MAAKDSRYTSIDDVEDVDLENDSDTTLASEGFLGKNTKRLSKHTRSSRLETILTWSRWATIVVLQGIILVVVLPTSGVLSSQSSTGDWVQTKTETGGDINGLYIPTSHKYTLLTFEESKYFPNMTSDINRMEIRHNWDMLLPLGSGSVSIPDYEQHPMLGKPINDDPIREGPIFEASWTHALHCLYYSVDTYHQLVVNNKFGFSGGRNDDHAAHCFEYLRTQILCMADMTLEGSQSVLDVKGNGQAHMCRNRDEAISWIEARRVDDIQSIIGP